MLQLSSQIKVTTEQGSWQATMKGCGKPETGIINADIHLLSDDVSALDPLIVCAFTITGTPIFANRSPTAHNLWEATGGSYVGMRELVFANRGRVSSLLVAERQQNEIQMKLNIWGSLILPPLVGIGAPFRETFTPLGHGRLRGEFEVEFKAADGSTLIGRATSQYALQTLEVLEKEHFRNIVLEGTRFGNRIVQHEEIFLFDERKAAETNLSRLRQSRVEMDALVA